MASDPRCTVPESPTGGSGPSGGCRIKEFVQYHPLVLAHERAHVLRALDKVFLSVNVRADLEHDLKDIDYLLAELEKRDEEGMGVR